jgi:hypothetical protein
LFHVVNSLSQRRFLVNTEAAYSIFPHTSKGQPSGPALQGPGGQAIPCWGEKELQLQIGDRLFTWTFLLAKIDFDIGADFLKHFWLAVDLATRQLIDTHSMSSLTGGAAQDAGGGLLAAVAAVARQYRSPFSEYPAVADSSGKLPPAKPDVNIICRPRDPQLRPDFAVWTPPSCRPPVRQDGGGGGHQDIAWSLPLHMVRKADGSWRPCGDYRRLNLVTQPDKYPVPNIQDLSSQLQGCNFFSKLDLRKVYYQIPMATADVPKTGVITPFGLFEFLRMSFGLKNEGQRFQRLMDRVLAGLDFVFIYLDDVIVGSRSEEEHLKHLHLVFARATAVWTCLEHGQVPLRSPGSRVLGTQHLLSWGEATVQACGGHSAFPQARGCQATAKVPGPREFL